MRSKIPFEYRIAIIYVVIGSAWILFSDEIVFRMIKDQKLLIKLSTFKGWFYVVVTAIMFFFLIKREISKRNKIYYDLLVANQKATESDRLKTAFLANLSHYIRTPMNSILGFSELLKQRNLDEEKRLRFLNVINEKSNLLLHTMNNIIEMSKIQEGQIQLTNTEFSINELLKDLTLSYSIELKKRNSNTILHYSLALENGSDRITTDFDKVHLIFSNLLSNAINFTEKGEIEIGYFPETDGILFFVRDTGSGVSEKKRPNLFSSFMNNGGDIQEIGEGTGLGLPLSSNMAKLLGGKLWLDYTGTKGSRFCFNIPTPKQEIDL
jgi:signal transduction histidine kinase